MYTCENEICLIKWHGENIMYTKYLTKCTWELKIKIMQYEWLEHI